MERKPFNPEFVTTSSTVASGDPLPARIEAVGRSVIGAAIEVHRVLGPGLVERVYEEALMYELGILQLSVKRQVEIAVPYKSIMISGQRLDVLVENQVIVELKSVAQVAEVHKAQLLSYLRAAQCPLGLLINFNGTQLRHGIHRVINSSCLGVREHASSSRSLRTSR